MNVVRMQETCDVRSLSAGTQHQIERSRRGASENIVESGMVMIEFGGGWMLYTENERAMLQPGVTDVVTIRRVLDMTCTVRC
jgi:hypothetical protein